MLRSFDRARHQRSVHGPRGHYMETSTISGGYREANGIRCTGALAAPRAPPRGHIELRRKLSVGKPQRSCRRRASEPHPCILQAQSPGSPPPRGPQATGLGRTSNWLSCRATSSTSRRGGPRTKIAPRGD